MFLISSNIITNSVGYFNGSSTTVATIPQSDIFITRASLGSISSISPDNDITNTLTNLSWSDPYLLTNYRYNIPSY